MRCCVLSFVFSTKQQKFTVLHFSKHYKFNKKHYIRCCVLSFILSTKELTFALYCATQHLDCYKGNFFFFLLLHCCASLTYAILRCCVFFALHPHCCVYYIQRTGRILLTFAAASFSLHSIYKNQTLMLYCVLPSFFICAQLHFSSITFFCKRNFFFLLLSCCCASLTFQQQSTNNYIKFYDKTRN